MRGVQLEQIRGDRVLHEALAVRADPLHLAAVFILSSSTAIAYAAIARTLLERPVEATASSPLDQSGTATGSPATSTPPAWSS